VCVADGVRDEVLPSVPSSPEYVKLAAAGDKYEITSSQLLLAEPHSAASDAFAKRMIADHTHMSQMMMMNVAQLLGTTAVAPPGLDVKRALMVSALMRAAGAEREQLYLQQQLLAHQEALALHQNYAQYGDNPTLRAVAAQAAPIVADQQPAAEFI
jgi:putative membrane protein